MKQKRRLKKEYCLKNMDRYESVIKWKNNFGSTGEIKTVKMVTIKYTLPASKDLEEIVKYISYDPFYYAGIQMLRLLERVKQLQTNQNIGSVVPADSIKKVREFIEGNYRTIYRIVDS